jgi:ribosomal protein L20A (L18A)
VNYKDVLNFWWFLDDLSKDQLKIVGERYQALDDDVWDATYELIGSHHQMKRRHLL